MDITNIIIRYYKVTNDSTISHLKMELYYSKGGSNVFNGKVEDRGYYISISPVKRERGFETYISRTGLKHCILKVDRKSKKKEEEAIKLFNTQIWTFKILYFNQYDIEIESCEVRL